MDLNEMKSLEEDRSQNNEFDFEETPGIDYILWITIVAIISAFIIGLIIFLN